MNTTMRGRGSHPSKVCAPAVYASTNSAGKELIEKNSPANIAQVRPHWTSPTRVGSATGRATTIAAR